MYLIRACREAVLTNFAGSELVKRAVAAELFHVWVKRGDNRESSSADPEAPSDAYDSPHVTSDIPSQHADPNAVTTGSLDLKLRSELADDVVLRFAGPVTSVEGGRIEIQMTVGEVRRARYNRLVDYRQLLVAMLNDPEVQSGELGVLETSAYPTPALTEHNSSAAASAAASAASSVTPNKNHGEVSMPSYKQRSEKRPSTEWSDGGSTLVQAERAKRPRDEGGRVGGGVEVEERDSGGQGSVPAGASSQGGNSEVTAPSASKRRRQLWMIAIRDNETRYERRKQEARREFELRQQQLLRWMVDEEAGRHEDSGEAGPPPMVEMERGAGPYTP